MGHDGAAHAQRHFRQHGHQAAGARHHLRRKAAAPAHFQRSQFLFRHDERLLRQRGRFRHIEAGQRAVRLHGQHEAVAQQHHHIDAVRQVQGRAHEGQVDAALVQQAGQGIHRVFARTDVDAGVAGAKAGKLALQHA